MKLDFASGEAAAQVLRDALLARLKERKLVHDVRVQLAIASLSNDELALLKTVASYPPDRIWGRPDKGVVDFFAMASIPRMLDKQLIAVVGQAKEGYPAYRLTPLGFMVARTAKYNLKTFDLSVLPEESGGNPS